MEPSSSDRPKLQKSLSNSSYGRTRRPSRSASKYGSIIVEEEDSNGSSNEGNKDDGLKLSKQRTRRPSNMSDRFSLNSLDYELTLKDKQDVKLHTNI
jgi:hypothetical protein